MADPGFPAGGGRGPVRGACGPIKGHGPPMWALFGKNVCKNKRIGSHRRSVRPARPLDPPMLSIIITRGIFVIGIIEKILFYYSAARHHTFLSKHIVAKTTGIL